MKHLMPVAITGVGCLCAAGNNLEVAMVNLYAGRQHSGPPQHFQTAQPATYPVFEIHNERAGLESGVARGSARTRDLALVAVQQALTDARWRPADLERYRVGVCMGTNVGSATSHWAFHRRDPEICALANPPRERFCHVSPTLGIITTYNLSGPSQTVVNACSAGTDALGLAAAWIRNDVCDMVIAGGADAMYEITYRGFIALMISDKSPCKPFDAHRNGLNLGEGAAVMIMESPALWRRRNYRPRATLLGYGASADAFHLTAPQPDGAGLRLALAEALQSAGKRPDQVAFINAHGTGTIDNDRIESRVLAEMFPGTPFLSTKGYTGHTLGAAGALEAALTIGSLEQQRLPPSAGCSIPDQTLAAAPVTRITPIRGSLALSQSMAFGGNNAAVILGTEDWAI